MELIFWQVARAVAVIFILSGIIWIYRTVANSIRSAKQKGHGLFYAVLLGILEVLGGTALLCGGMAVILFAIWAAFRYFSTAPTASAANIPPAVVTTVFDSGRAPVKVREEKTEHFAKFEVRVRDGMSVSFTAKNGRKTGAIIRVINDTAKTVLYMPVEDDAHAVIFPVRNDSDCSFETKETNGRYLTCRRIGSVRVGNEDWGIGYASYDLK